MTRKIKITMIPRVAEDSPKIMVNAAQAFPNDDIDIEIKDTDSDQTNLPDYETLQETNDSLDNQNQEINDGIIEVETEDVALENNTNWYKLVREEGFKAVARLAFSRALEYLQNNIGGMFG